MCDVRGSLSAILGHPSGVVCLKIDASEFEGNIEELSRILETKLQRKLDIHHRTLQVDDDVSSSKIKDALKHALHKLEPQRYHIIRELDCIKIKRLKAQPSRTKQKDVTPPSAPQTLPYFFPS